MSDDDDDLTISQVRALVGTTRRDSRWHLTDELEILCLFARARFDLREVETTGNDVVEVTVTCAFGSVDFIVPDGTVVVLDGTSFLASARSDVTAEGDSELPRIEITATTVLGRVKIISPSTDVDEDDATIIDVEPVPAPAAIEPAPAVEPAVAEPAAAPKPGPAASPMAVPKPPPSKYAVAAEDTDEEGAEAATPAPQPVVPQPPANKYAVPAEDTDEDGAAA